MGFKKEFGMKQGGLIIAGLVLMFTMVVLPVMADEQPHVNYETYIVDNFDSPGTDWTWQAVGSKFVTQGYPVLKYFDGMPNAIRITQADPNGKYKYMGLEVKFDRKGDNWVDIYPTKKDANGKEGPYEIPFKGRISRLDLWVWGAHYAYELEILVRDCNGRVHTLSFGPVNHEGWRNMSVNVPSSIQQVSPYLNGVQQMTLVAFRLRTRPTERVDDFYIFFDNFKALTDTYMPSYDGFELVGTKFGDSGNKEKAQ
jgi:Flagellar filament outer layer protein Flaa.